MMKKFATLIGGAAVAAAMTFSAGAMAGEVKGVWERVDGKSKLEIYDCGDKLCGKLVWLKEPTNEDGTPKLDTKNKDEKLRERPILGMEILKDMVADGKDEWADGEVYNPEDGKTYNAEMNLEGVDMLKMGGCVLFICKKAEWKRSSI